ncbi:MAG: T9SS type A sorting domain-containing protein [Saprospiraceae bacterium]|nr:T9SS type A sorting domain-containing protein [Saprospiraceae bacterium]MBK9630810.1 T9SS type A sorting domain-containing protein [Saprospiraceae bacterium]
MKYLLSIFLILIGSLIFAQNGISWNAAMNLSTNTYGNAFPRLAINRAGDPMVVWGRMSDQSVMFSRWNGTAFTTPVKLNPHGLTVASANWMGPDIAAFGDTVYVVVKRTPESIHTNRLHIFTSFDGGVSFKPPVELAFIADSFSRFPTVSTDLKGNPIVAYMKFNSSFLDSRWVVTKSNDYGNTFEVDVKASGWGNSAEVCDCCPGSLVSSDDYTALVYRDNNRNLRDIWTGISSDEGVSFSSGFEVDNNNWTVNTCPASGPDGVIVGDTLYSTFMSGKGGVYRNYLSKSSIKNRTAYSVVGLTGAITGLGTQNFPRIAHAGNAIAIVWRQNIVNTAQLPILFTNDLTKGFSSTYDLVDSDNITNTDVALSASKVYVVWQDDGTGTIKFRSGIYEPISTQMDHVNQNEFSIFPNPISDEINIISNSNFECSVNIYNALGLELISSTKNSNHKINTKHFSKGIYFVKIQSKNNSQTKIIVKQ